MEPRRVHLLPLARSSSRARPLAGALTQHFDRCGCEVHERTRSRLQRALSPPVPQIRHGNEVSVASSAAAHSRQVPRPNRESLPGPDRDLDRAASRVREAIRRHRGARRYGPTDSTRGGSSVDNHWPRADTPSVVASVPSTSAARTRGTTALLSETYEPHSGE